MSARKITPPASNYQQSPLYKSLKGAIDDSDLRTEALFDRLEKRLDRMDHDVRRAEGGQDRLTNELVELRRDVGELRDATHIAASKATSAAVEVADDLKGAIKRPLWMRWQAYATAIILFIALYKNFGTLAKDMTAFWRFIIGESPPAHVRPASESKAKDEK